MSFIDQLKEKFSKKKSGKSSEDQTQDNVTESVNSDDEEDTEPGEKTSKTKMLKPRNNQRTIVLAVILILALLFLFPSEEPAPTSNQTELTEGSAEAPLPEKKSKKEKNLPEPENSSQPTETTLFKDSGSLETESANQNAMIENPINQNTVEQTPSSQGSTDSGQSLSNQETTPSTSSSEPTPTESRPSLEEISQQIPQDVPEQKTETIESAIEEKAVKKKSDDTENSLENLATLEKTSSQTQDSRPESSAGVGQSSQNKETLDPEGNKMSQTDFTEDILRDLEKKISQDQNQNIIQVDQYVAPPDYENSGRGLVYNCVGKHWACIDAPSFKVCQKNYSYNIKKSSKRECYPDSIYENEKGCIFIQKRKTSSGKKLDYCP